MRQPDRVANDHYDSGAVDVYAAFRAMPNSTSVADDFNAMQAVARAVGQRSGIRIADLGCGPGLRTRDMAAMSGVAVAVGIDRSRDQLALARSGAVPANCRFTFGDLVALGRDDGALTAGDVGGLLGTFDVALMGFVASHAATQDELDAMLRTAAALLAPGGQLVIIDAHPRLDRAPFPRSEQYAVRKTFALPDDDSGAVPAFTTIRTTFVTPHGELTVEDYFHDVESWVTAVEAAGLSGLAIDDFVAPPGAEPGFWDAYITPDHPSGCSQAAVIRTAKHDDVRR